QMVVFASIDPEDIDPERVSKPGARLLRAYLERARLGLAAREAKAAPDVEATPPLVRTVLAALEAQGVAAEPSPGGAGSRGRGAPRRRRARGGEARGGARPARGRRGRRRRGVAARRRRRGGAASRRGRRGRAPTGRARGRRRLRARAAPARDARGVPRRVA